MYYSHSHRYYVRGSDTDDVNPDRITDKRNLKMGWMVPDNLFRPRKSICPYGKFTESMKGPANNSLREEAFRLELLDGHLDLHL